jgi:hypothetical protein
MSKVFKGFVSIFVGLMSAGPAISADYSLSVGLANYDYALKVTTEGVADLSFDGQQYEVGLQRATEDYTLSLKHTFSDPTDIANAEENANSQFGETLYMSQEETSVSMQRPINDNLNWFAGYYQSNLDARGHNDGTDGSYFNKTHSSLATRGAFFGVSAQRRISESWVLFGRGAINFVSADLHLADDKRLDDDVDLQQAITRSAYGFGGPATLLGLGLAYPLASGATIVLSYETKDFDFDEFYLNTTRSSIDTDWETFGVSISFGL